MKKECVVSRIEASQDGSPYVYVTFSDPNDYKPGAEKPQNPFGMNNIIQQKNFFFQLLGKIIYAALNDRFHFVRSLIRNGDTIFILYSFYTKVSILIETWNRFIPSYTNYALYFCTTFTFHFGVCTTNPLKLFFIYLSRINMIYFVDYLIDLFYLRYLVITLDILIWSWVLSDKQFGRWRRASISIDNTKVKSNMWIKQGIFENNRQ
jgi:hypothetical protein